MNNTYKPFDLELAKQGAKLITRDGREVTEFKYFESANKCAFVTDNYLFFCDENGHFLGIQESHEYDLFLAPLVKERWQNVYTGKPYIGMCCEKTERCDEIKDPTGIRTHYLKTYWLDGVIQPELSEWIKIEKE